MGATSPSASLSRSAAGGAKTLGVSRGPRLAILGRPDPLGTPPIFHWLQEAGKVADAFNDVVEQNAAMAAELSRRLTRLFLRDAMDPRCRDGF